MDTVCSLRHSNPTEISYSYCEGNTGPFVWNKLNGPNLYKIGFNYDIFKNSNSTSFFVTDPITNEIYQLYKHNNDDILFR